MTLLAYVAYYWLMLTIPLAFMLYGGYCAAMAFKRAKDAGLSDPHVFYTDTVLAIPVVLLDGAYNAFWMPILCFDLKPSNCFRKVTFKGVTFWFFELTTERLSRYNENPKEWKWRKFVARETAKFLDAKDPKGWHVRKEQT